MTPEQIALGTLRIQEIQTWITALAIFLGPLSGVLFTLWFQARKEIRNQRHQLFLDLMSERKTLYVSQRVAQALNKIDVIYARNPAVKKCWHEYYALLQQPAGELRIHKWLELLSTMAETLGYSDLSQTDLDKFYIPQGHADDLEFQRKTSHQWARVLENTEHLMLKTKKNL